TEGNLDNSFTGDDLSSFGDLPDFANLETNAAPEESTETEESENNAPADESFAGFAEQSDLGDAAAETESAENDLIGNTELPDFDDTFAADETESESEELPDFGGDFTAENDLIENEELPDFADDFAAESTEPAESEITKNAEIETEPSGDIFETESVESSENTEGNLDNSFTDNDLSSFGDLPDFADDEANNFAEDDSANEASTDSYFDEAAAVAAMASAGAMGFAAGAASGTGETSDENFVNDGDDDDFSLDDFSDLDADFEMPNEEALAELDKEIDEINMNFSNQTALNEANSFADYFSEDSTYDDLADSYNSSYAAENGITNFDFLNDKSSRPKLPLVPLVCVLCAVISIASCFVIWLLFLNNKNTPAPVVAETAVTKEYQGVSVLKEDPAKPESTASQLEKAMAQENSIIIIDAPIVIPIPVVPVVNQEETKRYQIKRGDTLWDIADSFYKNPWMYEKIAKANRIKNPDYILSGTWIEIPPM
ncbi:MAG: LysM peptidoglycan-binding domain-containing protein, partial [Treponemataceae bacterium]|nr:LysM peptidoglycan-binding domain-containing protein [Treponemataceae bacterium]